MKVLVFDSGPLINLSMNGLLSVLEKLKEKWSGVFVMTHFVKQEVHDRPMHIAQFELGALRVGELLAKKILVLPESIGVSRGELEEETRTVMECANKSFVADGHPIRIVSDAEMSCFALAQLLKKKGHQVMIAIDERTARLLTEKPENIEELMSRKLHQRVRLEKRCISNLQGIPCIRSSELVYVAYKKGHIPLKDPNALEALVYATKFKGAAISWDEINILKKL